MKTLGFTKNYYTLWDVYLTEKPIIINGRTVGRENLLVTNYQQNISQDLETAREWMNEKFGDNWDEDLSLHGLKAWGGRQRFEYDSEFFNSGKYRGELIRETKDLDYLEWYWSKDSKDRNPVAQEVLLENGRIIKYQGEYCIKSDVERLKANARMEDLEKGHHFSKSIEADVEVLNEFSFEGTFGRCYVVSMDCEGKLVQYMGSNPPEVEVGGVYTLRAQIKHGYYRGLPRTYLQRIKILDKVEI